MVGQKFCCNLFKYIDRKLYHLNFNDRKLYKNPILFNVEQLNLEIFRLHLYMKALLQTYIYYIETIYECKILMSGTELTTGNKNNNCLM